MTHTHKRVVCTECETVVSNCRCSSPDKVTEYTICDKCKEKPVRE